MEAQVRRQADSLQLSYNLDFRPLGSAVYPLPSVDGASVVVTSHSRGIRVFKVYHDERSHGKDKSHPEFEDASNQHASRLTKWLDIGLDNPAQRIAFPPITPSVASDESTSAPDFLSSDAVIAVACADSSIYLISFALGASEQVGDKEQSSEYKLTRISSVASHQDLIASLALTWTTDLLPASNNKVGSRSRNRTDPASNTTSQTQHSFLVASASTTGSGLLVVHRLSFQRQTDGKGPHPILISRQFIRLPLLSSTLSFSPAVYPSPKHSTLLLTSPAHGTVKILDVLGVAATSRKRRTSAVEADDQDSTTIPAATICVSLNTDFAMSTAPPRRKQILDAQWAAHGRAIITLLEDGEWGVWNLEGAESTNTDTRKRRTSSSGISSVSLNRFAIRGNVSTALQKKKQTMDKSKGALAPMTPHTRKTRSADLFGQGERMHAAATTSIPVGRIYTCGRATNKSLSDDMIIVSYAGSNSLLPSLQSIWRTEGDKNAGGKAISGRLQTLPTPRLGGEKQLSIQPLQSQIRKSNGFLAVYGSIPDMLVVTDSRIIVHSRLELHSAIGSASLNLPLRNSMGDETTITTRATDDEILDLDAMDQMLESMNHSETHARPDSIGTTAASSALFQPPTQQQILDLETMSPTVSKSSKSKLVVDRGVPNKGNNLFG